MKEQVATQEEIINSYKKMMKGYLESTTLSVNDKAYIFALEEEQLKTKKLLEAAIDRIEIMLEEVNK